MSHCIDKPFGRESAGFSSTEQSLFFAIFLCLAIALLGYVQWQLSEYVGGGNDVELQSEQLIAEPSNSKELLDAFESDRLGKN